MTLFAGSARAEDEVTAFSTTEMKTELVYGNPGILPCAPEMSIEKSPEGDCWYEDKYEERLPYVLIDATEGKTMFPLEENARAFADQKEFLAFVEQSLNARPVYDELGELVGVEGESLELGKPATSDGFRQQVELVADPIAAFLGGKANAFKIADELYILPSQEEIRAQVAITAASGALPSSGEKCNPAGTDCVRGESFVTHAGVYHSAGSSTKQTVGGYREWSYFCWKVFVPWSCTGRSGSNRLFASSAIFFPAFNGEPALLTTRSANQANTTEVTAKAWQIGFKGQVANASGACGSHGSEHSGSLSTGSGRFDGHRCGG
jgi:hypothetical protein